jgi:hypothetical protein
VAIGPRVIAPAAARLGQGFTYDIYVSYALGEIPTQASAEALLNYTAAKQALEEYEAEALADLGHASGIPFLRDYYDTSNPPVGTVLYRLALLNDYTGPEMVEWWAVAFNDYVDLKRAITSKNPTWLPSPGPAPTGKGQKQAPSEKKRKKRKKRRR